MFKKEDKQNINLEGKVIDIETGIEGNVKFSGPISLRINGKFEGELETKGILIIGENADVKAKIVKGDTITIAGKVKGDIVCSKCLELAASARVIGNVQTPLFAVSKGAILKGDCQMPSEEGKSESKESSKKKE